MRLDRDSRLARVLAVAVTLALGTIGLAACGGDDGESLTFEVTDQGITGPDSADSGSAEITLENQTDETADLQLFRVEGDRTAADVIRTFGQVIEGQPIPDWFFAGGGVGSTRGGESSSVTQVLEPGRYFAANTELQGPPQPDEIAEFEVTGEASDEELEADVEVQAIDYGFRAEGLEAGENEILFSNVGAQPHHLLASKAVGDATAEDAERFFRTEGGRPPLRERGTQATTVLEGGDSQLVTLDLEPGKYILYCFITDRQGGPPHALKGMVDEVEVK